MGAGTNCESTNCPLIEGACCYHDGSCSIIIEGSPCEGVYLGPDSTCEQCLQVTGACCLPDGSCQRRLDIDCRQGYWMGPDTYCDALDYCYWDPVIEFSLDVGSDTELSDPCTTGNEGFDPGDIYLSQSSPVTQPGRDGFRDDEQIFGVDPYPNAPDPCVPPATSVPVGEGSGLDYVNYFDLDAHDILDTPIMFYITLDPGPTEPISEYEVYSTNTIFSARFLAVSFDDDCPAGWPDGDVPVTTQSKTGIIYGSAVEKDEVIGITLKTNQPWPYSIAAAYPVADEITVHQSLLPDPCTEDANNDDVDSLDIVGAPNVEQFWLFSVDHEASADLDPGNIYLAESPGTPTLIIDKAIHLGLVDDPQTAEVLEDADIDAFEFVWLQPGYPDDLLPCPAF
ncbi:MAG: hypothetical protein JXB29_13255 [Sedimentisphaerales bacterium]|nr:hypothetical protein [Sedimentisphaerales bacterium]